MIAKSLAKSTTHYLSDDRLVSEAKSGNRQAFGDLCLRYSGMLRQRILAIVRHREDAEDALQETLLSAKTAAILKRLGIERLRPLRGGLIGGSG